MKLVRYKKNPILKPDPQLPFEKAAVYNPCATVFKSKVFLVYRAEGAYYDRYVSCLCLAESRDGIKFKKYHANPIIKPSRIEEKRGCEDPRIARIKNVFYLTYTAYDGKKVGVSLATSKDLVTWKKYGVVVKGLKSAQILEQPIHGDYLMFVGEAGGIRIARSKNLKDWAVDKKLILKPRKNMFDSSLVEVGPPLIVTKDKIIMIYNSADRLERYSPSYCVLDKNDPHRILYRHSKPLASPSAYYELYGKVNYVIFTEGLVKFKNKYLLYYGAADKAVGVGELQI